MLVRRTFVLLVLILSLGLLPGVLPASARSTAAPDAPIIFHTESATIYSLTYQTGYLVWSHSDGCPGGEFAEPCVIEIKNEGSESTYTYPVVGTATGSTIRSNLAADNDAYLYWQDSSGNVVRHSRYSGTGTPADLVAVKETAGLYGEMTVDGSYVYWTENNIGADTGRLFRAPKEGGARELMAESPDSVMSALQADGLGGVLFISDTCGGICLPDILQRVAPNGGGFSRDYGTVAQAYTFDGTNVYYVSDSGADGLHLGQAPLTDLGSFSQIQDLPDKGDDSDYVEDIVLLNGDLFFHIGGTGGGPIFRYALSGGAPVPLTENLSVVDDLIAGERYLFYVDSPSIFKLDPETGAFQADLRVTDIEITQGIQNLANDVPLIQDKPTHVRVYPAVTGSVGPEVTAKIVLHGERGGSPLPGSPLSARFVTVKTAGNLRENADDTADWTLPPAWLQGDLTLRAEISNPHYFDPDVGDNSLSLARSFTSKANICIKFVPIQTWQGLTYWTRNPLSGAPTPGFLEIVNRLDTLWGARRVVWYTQYVPLKKPQFLGTPQPFNMAGAADKGHVIGALYEHNIWDGAPDWCGGGNARTHYVAMVHPGINLTRMNDDGTTSTTTGYASFGEPLSWVQMNPGSGGSEFATPRGGTTLAQEIGHNYNDLLGASDRWKHVNCGLPSGDDPHDAYPYITDTIGPVGPTTYWGFDRRSGVIFQPDQARDYMSYCGPRWTSDYNWRGSQNATQNLPTAAALSAPEIVSGTPFSLRSLFASLREAFRARLAPQADTLILYGIINQDETSAEFPVAYRLANTLVGELAERLPAEGIAFLGDSGHGDGPDGDFDPITGSYALEFVDASGAVLATHTISPAQGTHGGQYAFLANLPYPAGTAAVRLNRNGAEFLTREASPNAPTVNVNRPSAGENVTGPLVIEWSAADADGDPLTYVVQYSPDGGATWTMLASQLDETGLTLDDTSTLQGSADARIRVIANDGLNLGMGTSSAFSLENHAPRVWIDGPPGAFSVSAAAVLSGLGLDPEEGELPDGALDWAIDGPSAHSATGAQFSLSGLAPGTYTAALTATDGEGLAGVGSKSFTVATKRVFDAAEAPTMDGFCDDAAYTGDLHPVALSYTTGETAGAWMAHDPAGGRLYVCIDGMPQKGGASEIVGLFVDPDNSGGPVMTAADKAFYLRRDGLAQTAVGNAAGGITLDPAAVGLLGAVSESGGLWSAELRIDLSAVGGWDKLVRLAVAHGSFAAWPAAGGVAPDSWGETAFGSRPQTIAFPQPSGINLLEGLTTLPAQASSGLPVTLASNTPQTCEAAGQTIILLAAGECSLTASQPGDAAYAAAPDVTRTLMIQDQPKIFLPAVVK